MIPVRFIAVKSTDLQSAIGVLEKSLTTYFADRNFEFKGFSTCIVMGQFGPEYVAHAAMQAHSLEDDQEWLIFSQLQPAPDHQGKLFVAP